MVVSRNLSKVRVMSTSNVILPSLCITYAQRKVQPRNQAAQLSTSYNRIIHPVMETIMIKSKPRLDPMRMISLFPTRCLVVGKMASYATFQYNVLVIDIDNTTLGLMRLFR